MSVIGQDDFDVTIDAIIQIAKAFEARIPGEGEMPELVRLLTRSQFFPPHSVYIKGQIGLFNYFPLPPDTIIGFDEGVVGSHEHVAFALLKYPSKSESINNFGKAVDVLRQDSEDLSDREQSFSVEQGDGKRLYMKTFQQYIIVVLGDELQQIEEFSQRLEALLNYSILQSY